MKPKKRWSWFFGGEPSKPPKKKRRPGSHRMSDGHRFNGRADERFSNASAPRRSTVQNARDEERTTPRFRREEIPAARRTPQRLRLEGAHDFYIANESAGQSMILRSCRMRGFSEFLPVATSEENGPTAKWLILEHPDGKLSYVLSDRVWYIQETSETVVRSGGDLANNDGDPSKSG